MIIEKIKKVIKNPILILVHMCRYWPFRYISDKKYLELFFKGGQGRKLDIENPKTYTEKLQWLKLYNRKPEYTMMSDKYLVRNYVENKIGEKYLIPLLGVWDSVDEINIDDLPNQFVLKTNHDSGSIIICKDKKIFDWKYARKTLRKALKTQYYWKSREYNYYNINRKIIAEQYMVDKKDGELRDYKFYCFNGEPKFIQVDVGRFSNHIENFYTLQWEFIPVEWGVPNNKDIIKNKPEKLDEMIRLAINLSRGIPHVRVDFYIVNGNVYFGELTFHSSGGIGKIIPELYDYKWGRYLTLPSNI